MGVWGFVWKRTRPARHDRPGRATMEVDITTDTIIEGPRDQVAAYAGNPDNAPTWYVDIKSVEWKKPASG